MLLALLALAHATCPPGSLLVVHWSDPLRAAVYRNDLLNELANVRLAPVVASPDGCPRFEEGGITDFVDIAGLGAQDQQYRLVVERLLAVLSAPESKRRELAERARDATSGYSDESRIYLERFLGARERLEVSEHVEGDRHLVYLRLWKQGQLVPGTAAFTFETETQRELGELVRRAVIDLFPELDTPPATAISARQATSEGHPPLEWVGAGSFHVRPGTPVVLDGSHSTDRQTRSDDLSFAWRLDGAPLPEAGPLLTRAFGATELGAHSVEVTVSDGRRDTTASLEVHVVSVSGPDNATATVQNIGWRPMGIGFDPVNGGARYPLVLRARADAAEGFHWRQVAGPALGCLSASAETCDDTQTLDVRTTPGELQLHVINAGTYQFDVTVTRAGVESQPTRVTIDAVFTRSSRAGILDLFAYAGTNAYIGDEVPPVVAGLAGEVHGLGLALGVSTGLDRWWGGDPPVRFQPGLILVPLDLVAFVGEFAYPGAAPRRSEVEWTPSGNPEFEFLADIPVDAEAKAQSPAVFSSRIGARLSAYGASLRFGLQLRSAEGGNTGVADAGGYLLLAVAPYRAGGYPTWPTPRRMARVADASARDEGP